MGKKYKSIFQKNTLSFLVILILFKILLIEQVFASGAYDKGTATGKGRFEFSLTVNPFGIVPYGQNYGILSYGISNKIDIVAYYSKHQNGTKSQYLGAFYQFFNSERLDLATALGFRYQYSGKLDIFAPQLLYNYHITNNYSLGGSIVKVIENDNFIDRGTAIDITLYKKMNSLIKLNNKINDFYLGIGIFKNSSTNLLNDKLYLHYSVDVVF